MRRPTPDAGDLLAQRAEQLELTRRLAGRDADEAEPIPRATRREPSGRLTPRTLCAAGAGGVGRRRSR